jgi:hypothetical protein
MERQRVATRFECDATSGEFGEEFGDFAHTLPH